MKTNATWSLAASLIILAATAGAGTINKASTDAQKEDILIVGPIDSNNLQSSATILGQKIPISIPETDYTNVVHGTVGSDGSLRISNITQDGQYIAGATPVLLTGIVQRSNQALARITIGTATVDLTAALAGSPGAFPPVGALVQIKGTQPVMRGIILATEMRVGSQIATFNLSATLGVSSSTDGGITTGHSLSIGGSGIAGTGDGLAIGQSGIAGTGLGTVDTGEPPVASTPKSPPEP